MYQFSNQSSQNNYTTLSSSENALYTQSTKTYCAPDILAHSHLSRRRRRRRRRHFAIAIRNTQRIHTKTARRPRSKCKYNYGIESHCSRLLAQTNIACVVASVMMCPLLLGRPMPRRREICVLQSHEPEHNPRPPQAKTRAPTHTHTSLARSIRVCAAIHRCNCGAHSLHTLFSHHWGQGRD